MKTSNKIILSAFVIFAISLGVYNTALKAEYQTGKYKDPNREYNSYQIDGFDEIDINAAGMMRVDIEQGPFLVKEFKRSQDSLRITKVGNRLVVDIDLGKKLEDKDANGEFHIGYNKIVISCPKLKVLKTDNFYTVNGKRSDKMNVSTTYDTWDPNTVKLIKFKQDSLSLWQNDGMVTIKSCDFGFLTGKALKNSILNIETDNHINKADLTINDAGTLKINRANIQQLSLGAADSTHISLSGSTLNHLISKK